MKSPSEQELRELIHKGWMTHDGLWFAQVLMTHGIESANRLNKGAIRMMAPLEIGRVRKAYGCEEIQTFDDLTAFLSQALGVLKAEFMEFHWEPAGTDTILWRMDRCFALEGMTRLGVADRYECGIYERVDGWLAALGMKWTATPEVHGCLKLKTGECRREYRFDFSGASVQTS
jgi:hypothetical protein